MSLVKTAWSWNNGTWHERAEMVRSHANPARPIPRGNLLTLFCLTSDGLDKILCGDDWRPEYESH
jgi:hypothetical protein